MTNFIQISHKECYMESNSRIRLVLLVSILIAMLGCGESRGRDVRKPQVIISETPSSLPSRKNLIDATHPAYKPQLGAIQECLGRLVFELPH